MPRSSQGGRIVLTILALVVITTSHATAEDGIFLSFSSTQQVQTPPQGQIQPGELFQFYILGSFSGSVSGWEAGVSIPENITVTNRALGLAGSFNVSDATVDDWIVGIEGCLLDADGLVVLATYDAELSEDVGQVEITLTESRVATAGVGKTAWVTCDALAPQLNDCDTAGNSVIVNPSGTAVASMTPRVTRLLNGVPNPFNPSTAIRFEMARSGEAELRIYDTAGKLVREFDRMDLTAGVHEQIWNGTDDAGVRVASGAYYVRLQAGPLTDSLRIVLLK